MEASERVVDKQYLQLLETKLNNIKNPTKLTAKTFLSDIASYKDHQLFKLMTEVSETSGFEDNFVVDAPITPNYLQRKLAPQTCAINKQELIKLLKADSVQMFCDELEKDQFAQELKEVSQELAMANAIHSSREPDEAVVKEESKAAISNSGKVE